MLKVCDKQELSPKTALSLPCDNIILPFAFVLLFSFNSSEECKNDGKPIMGTVLALVFSFMSYYIVYILGKMSDEWEGERLAAYHGVFTFINCFAGDNAICKSCIGFIPATCQWAYDKCIGNEEASGNRIDERNGDDPLLGGHENNGLP